MATLMSFLAEFLSKPIDTNIAMESSGGSAREAREGKFLRTKNMVIVMNSYRRQGVLADYNFHTVCPRTLLVLSGVHGSPFHGVVKKIVPLQSTAWKIDCEERNTAIIHIQCR